MKYQMIQDDYYGKVILPEDIFLNLEDKYFISGCTENVKFMCANKEEGNHLISLGVDLVTCDWYKIVKKTKYAHDERTMTLFRLLCKGCVQPLKKGQVVRLNGCTGEYRGNGRAGSFDAELLNDYSIIAWHEECFKNASVKQKLDDTASIVENHNG
jgi:hypothetical protein